jgi:hypothetical protein
MAAFQNRDPVARVIPPELHDSTSRAVHVVHGLVLHPKGSLEWLQRS